MRRSVVARLVCLLVCLQLVAQYSSSSSSSLPYSGGHTTSSSSSWLLYARALRIDLDPGEQFAITEVIPPNTVLTFQFQAVDRDFPVNVMLVAETLVGDTLAGDSVAAAAGGGAAAAAAATADGGAAVVGQGNRPLSTWTDQPEGVHEVSTRAQSRVVRIIFDNNPTSMTTKSVHFYLRTRINYDHVADETALDPIEQKARALTASMQHLQTLQMRLRQQQRAHRATVERANSRLLWWSVFQVVALLAMSTFQLYFLKRFLERKTYL